ncbi:MAG TPA: hypothetical protein PKW80_01900 [Bacteroidales bacterium]|nr:hypothetical protein [Bacteroidales bacterium]
MKKIFIVIISCVCAFAARSQDIIVTNSGKEIKTQVVETTPDHVIFRIFNESDKQPGFVKLKIKQFRRQNLPVTEQSISMPRREVFMINYENGKNDIYKEKVGDQTVMNVMNFIDINNNAEAYKMYRSGYKRYSLSRGLIGAGGGLLTFGTIALIVSNTDGKKDKTNIGASYIYMGAGTIFLAAGLPLYFTAKKKMNTAFEMYKNTLKTSQNNYKLDLGLTGNGLGLNLKF